jgi:hypothetical protein
METPRLFEQLQELEVALHQPAIRRDQATLERLLHPRFREFGRSGRSYTKADVLANLAAEQEATDVWSQNFEIELLGDDSALLTYRSAHVVADGKLERHTNRSSLWVRAGSAWQMLFHQGTPSEPFERAQPNHSIKRTSSSGLRPLPAAAHVKR